MRPAVDSRETDIWRQTRGRLRRKVRLFLIKQQNKIKRTKNEKNVN